jgi:hypothetical protein
MKFTIPDIPEHERTPLVLSLLDRIPQQHESIARLADAIATLKGLKPRPTIQPSALETAPPQAQAAPQKRPGAAKRPRAAQLTIDRDVLVPLPDPPAGAVFKGYEDDRVQERILRAAVIRYRRERGQLPDGSSRLAPLPAAVIPGDHFGPVRQAFTLDQYHDPRGTPPLLRAQVRQLGIDRSAGQLPNLLTPDQEAFHQEKDEGLPTGLPVSSAVGVDDTGARPRGPNGSCLPSGTDLCACLHSRASKSRLNFLEALRRPHTDYVGNEVTQAYGARPPLSAAGTAALTTGPAAFADPAAWQAPLAAAGVTGARHVRRATAGALLGSLVAHGVSPAWVGRSDGAPPFDVLAQASGWLHAERPRAPMVPFGAAPRQALADVRHRRWALYQERKAYRQKPDPSQQAGLAPRFDALCARQTGYPSVDGVLTELRAHKADRLRRRDRPAVPLHNNVSARHRRADGTRRTVRGGTRRAAGRRCRDTFASLTKTCRCLGVNFWT